MQSTNFTAYTEDASQIEAVKAFMKALKIKFEITKEMPHNQEFVQKIKQSKEDYKNGKGKVMSMDELNCLWK